MKIEAVRATRRFLVVRVRGAKLRRASQRGRSRLYRLGGAIATDCNMRFETLSQVSETDQRAASDKLAH